MSNLPTIHLNQDNNVKQNFDNSLYLLYSLERNVINRHLSVYFEIRFSICCERSKDHGNREKDNSYS